MKVYQNNVQNIQIFATGDIKFELVRYIENL